MYSTREWECRSITDSIQINGLTCVFSRYVIRSKAPSGGMKEMVLSLSNRVSRTHWWNLTSSSSTDLPGCGKRKKQRQTKIKTDKERNKRILYDNHRGCAQLSACELKEAGARRTALYRYGVHFGGNELANKMWLRINTRRQRRQRRGEARLD